MLVNGLAKLHNFCINEKEGNADVLLNIDEEYMMTNTGGYIEMVNDDTQHNIPNNGLRAPFSGCALRLSAIVE